MSSKLVAIQKSIRIKPANIQDVAVAFANAEGGTIVVGIEDDDAKKYPNLNDRWKGADHIEDYNPIIANLFMRAKESMMLFQSNTAIH